MTPSNCQRSVLYAITDALAIRTLLRRELACLSGRGWQVSVVCGQPVENAHESPCCQVYVVPMTRSLSPFRDLIALSRMVALVRRIRPDMVVASTPKAGLIGMLAAALSGVAVRVYTLRGLRLETAKFSLRTVLTLAERLACRCAHRVLCVSPSLRQLALEFRIAGPRKLVSLGAGSSTGVDIGQFQDTAVVRGKAASIRAHLKIPEKAPVIGFVGRLTADKGINDLLAAFTVVRRTLPAAHLLLVGTFEDGDPLPETVMQTIASDPQIRHVPWVAEPAPYYYVMRVLALPTYREGFPNVALEAAAAGRPVVGTVATGVVDAVVDGSTGLLSPVAAPAALAANILRLLTTDELVRRMGEAGRRNAAAFSSQIVLDRLLSFYENLCAQQGLVCAGADRAPREANCELL